MKTLISDSYILFLKQKDKTKSKLFEHPSNTFLLNRQKYFRKSTTKIIKQKINTTNNSLKIQKTTQKIWTLVKEVTNVKTKLIN